MPSGVRRSSRAAPRRRFTSGSAFWLRSRCWHSTAALAAHLLAKLTTPSDALFRVERKLRLQEALNAMDPIDCEILVLRHYEELTNNEAAQVLGLDKSAASKRYTRALTRLKAILTDRPGAGADLEEHS